MVSNQMLIPKPKRQSCCIYIYNILIQNKGKESENSYRKLKSSWWTGTRTHTLKQNQNISTDAAILLNQKRANVCEHMTRMASLEFLKGATRGLREEWMEGNLKGVYPNSRFHYSQIEKMRSNSYIGSLRFLYSQIEHTCT